MDEDDRIESLRDVVRLLAGIQQDRDVADLMESFKATPDLAGTPMPDTAHPALSHAAEFVRRADLETVVLPGRPRRDIFTRADEDIYPMSVELPRGLLHRRKCVGPAPYVGRRFVYVWDAWVDTWGRSICGSATLVRL